MSRADKEPLERLPAVVSRLQSALADLHAVTYELTTGRLAPPAPEEEYLSLQQLVARIPYRAQTIRNMMVQGELREGEHYLQRRRHSRIVFKWSRMQEWLRQRPTPGGPVPFIPAHAHTRKER